MDFMCYSLGILVLRKPAGERERGADYGNYSNIRSIFAPLLGALGVLAALVACASHSPRWTAPAAIELRSAPSAATVHFPAGIYTLEREDSDGYYYRAPGGVTKHAFSGSQQYPGGIFVSRQDPRRLRGYIVWAGGWTKIGNLSSEPHSFIR